MPASRRMPTHPFAPPWRRRGVELQWQTSRLRRRGGSQLNSTAQHGHKKQPSAIRSAHPSLSQHTVFRTTTTRSSGTMTSAVQ
nr:unnamed protein product [Callosobruchus chinensis]